MLAEKLELGIVDEDIADIFRKIGSGKWQPGLPTKIQIARSLKQLVEMKKYEREHDVSRP